MLIVEVKKGCVRQKSKETCVLATVNLIALILRGVFWAYTIHCSC